MQRLRSLSPASIALAALALVFAVAGTATAAKLIGSKQIRNNSIRSVDVKNNSLTGQDIKNGSIQVGDLAPAARPQDPPAEPETDPHWGVIARNTIGSPVTELRTGPFVAAPGGDVVAPPYGDGSLGIEVMAGEGLASKEKAAYGNEVDFAGDNFLELTDIGFHVFTTGENFSRGEPMPVINIELDPNLDLPGADDYTTATWVPDDVAAEHINSWSPYIDATADGEWFLTGGEGTATGCVDGCSWTELVEKLDDGGDPPSILTLGVGKGRDTGFVGAVDGLRVNDTIYDFEPVGVVERPAEG
jgi:hypothetical protein